MESIASIDAVDNVCTVGSKREDRLTSLEIGDILILQHIGVTSGANQPHIGDTASEKTRTTTDNNLAVLCHIPVETNTRRHIDSETGKVGSAQACERALGILGSDIGKILVQVIIVERNERHFKTQTGSQLEVFAEFHFVLCIERSLIVVESGVHHCSGVVKIGMGNHHRQGVAAILEGLP